MDINLTWVTECAKCSLDKAFEALVEGVRGDVAIANEHVRSGVSFEARTVNSRDFRVIRTRNLGAAEAIGIVFDIMDGQIRVRRLGAQLDKLLFTARPRLSFEGECVFDIREDQGTPYREWQVRRRALEDLFFEL